MANNPYVNKVVYGGNTLIDLTQDTVTSSAMLSGFTAHDKSGAAIVGNISALGASTYNASTTNQTIAGGQFLSGAQTILGITTANIDAANIKYNVVVKVGDTGSDTRIKNVTGSFTGAGTVTDGQIAVTSAQILQGYSGFIDGEEVKGNIATKSAANLTASGSVVTAPAGYYAAAASKAVAGGTATTPAVTITATATPTLNTSTGVVSVTVSGDSSITPTVAAGYISAGTAGTVSVTGTGTLNLTTQAAKTVTPTESVQTAVAANRYTTGAVKVAAISSDYVGSAITQRSSADLTASGSIVTAPAGYYSADATKAVSAGSAKTPATTITVTPSISVSSTGLISITNSSTKSITPTVTAGYVSSGTAGTVTVTGSSSLQLTASTITEGTTTVSGSTATRGTLGLGQGWENGQTISAATFANTATSGTTYIDISNTTDAPVLVSGSYLFINKGWTDNLRISLAKLVPDGASADLASDKILSGYSAYDNAGTLIAGSIQSKTAATYTPTTSNQTIASGQYLSGVQTIAGDANLVADKIRSGYSIFGVAGSYVGTTVSFTETDNEYGGKTVTITVTEPAAAS